MAKDYKTMMKERRARQGGGVPQVDPDDVVLAKLEGSSSQAMPLPSSAAADTHASDDRIKVSSFMYRKRHKQVKQEAIDTEQKEWQIIEQALDLYFTTHRPSGPPADVAL